TPLRYSRENYGYRYDVPASERTDYADKQRAARETQRRRVKDYTRRAGLTPAQRAWEDLNLARKGERHMEKERRKGMTYEQRNLAEALDRHGYRLKLELLNPTTHMPMLRRAATAMVDRLEAAITTREATKLSDMLDDLIQHLPPNHTYRPLVERLRALNMNVSVMYGPTAQNG